MGLVNIAKRLVGVSSQRSPNELIGGIPTMQYFVLPFRLTGRGGAIRFFMLTNGVEFKETYVTFDEWGGGLKTQLQESGDNPAGHLPIVRLGNRVLTEHTSILRLFSRLLGMYGQDAWQDFSVDQISDEYQTWRAAFVKTIMANDPGFKQSYVEEQRPFFYKLFNTMAATAKATGRHIVGDKDTFADALVFNILWDDQQLYGSDLLPNYPMLAQFYKAYSNQVAVQKYLDTLQKAGAAEQ